MPATATATIVQGLREIPIAKDSEWVNQRRHFETGSVQTQDGAFGDVLLCLPDGRLTEGLITNLFVVVAVPAEPTTHEEDTLATSMSTSRIEVQTAGVKDGVVWGTMRQRVMEACRTLGLGVREVCPRVQERLTWKEAFLTNALRGVQPLCRVTCTCEEVNACRVKPWTLEFDESPAKWTGMIRGAVAALLCETDIRTVI